MRLVQLLCLLVVAGSAVTLPAGQPQTANAYPPQPGSAVDADHVTSPGKTILSKLRELRSPTRVIPDADTVGMPVSVLRRQPQQASTNLQLGAPLKASLRLIPSRDQSAAPLSTAANVQFESDVPRVSVRTVGPDTLVVGRSARYAIALTNHSNFIARDVDVRCSIPSWVTLDSHAASQGTVVHNDGVLVWNVAEVPARGGQELLLDLTPTAGKGFELEVDVSVRPTQARKRIAIKEPKLQVEFNGPGDLVYGTPSSWEIDVANPGTGDAHEVVLDVLAGTRRLATCEIGTVRATAKRTVLLEVSSFESESTELSARVSGDPGVSDSAKKKVQVRRGKLDVKIGGPELDYVGGELLYQTAVSNSGDAPLKNVTLTIGIPGEMEYVSGVRAPTVSADGLSWVVPRIDVGQELSFPIRLAMKAGGTHELKVTAVSLNNQIVTDTTVTEGLTSADLKLEVEDPRGPRPLGTRDEFVIRVTNRGTDAARGVNVIAVCAPTVEPIDVDGNAVIKSGQIFFRPVDLPAHHQVTYKVIVRATAAGTHAFRAIVTCRDPDLRLAAEESTKYFERMKRGPGKSPIASQSTVEEPPARRPQTMSRRKQELRSDR